MTTPAAHAYGVRPHATSYPCSGPARAGHGAGPLRRKGWDHPVWASRKRQTCDEPDFTRTAGPGDAKCERIASARFWGCRVVRLPAGRFRCFEQEAPRGPAASTKRVTGPPSYALLGQGAPNVSATRAPDSGAAGWFACRPGTISVLRAGGPLGHAASPKRVTGPPSYALLGQGAPNVSTPRLRAAISRLLERSALDELS